MNSLAQAQTSTTSSTKRVDTKIKKGESASHDGWLVWDDGYKFLRAASEQNAYLEKELFDSQDEENRSSLSPITAAAVGLALGVGVSLAIKDENDFYKFAVGGLVGGLTVWSFR